jgi:hypothetical protein
MVRTAALRKLLERPTHLRISPSRRGQQLRPRLTWRQLRLSERLRRFVLRRGGDCWGIWCPSGSKVEHSLVLMVVVVPMDVLQWRVLVRMRELVAMVVTR